jgi:sialate O-acetylesterase
MSGFLTRAIKWASRRLGALSMAAGLVAVGSGAARGAIRLPAVIAENMVLQRDQPAPIWGWSDPRVQVRVGFHEQERFATADGNGRWTVRLEAEDASDDPRKLTITAGDEKLTLGNIVVGEVWVCSGQSNMEKPIGDQPGQKPCFDATEEIAAADWPMIRLFKTKKAQADRPAEDVEGEWVVCTPESIDATKFSAVGYFFGREIHREVGVPVGLIDSTWGGTRIEPWTPAEAFGQVAGLEELAAAAKKPGTKAENTMPATLYNGMIAPLVPFAIRGAIWYQGESNVMDVNDGHRYTAKMEALIGGWRRAWEQGDFPFYFVQIAPYRYHKDRGERVKDDDQLPLLWEAQVDALKMAHTGMAGTTDLVDDLRDIHPRNKKDVGLRLARIALATDYGKHVQLSGPVFKRADFRADDVVLHVDHGGGLASRDGKPLTWFTIAGEDGKFVQADAAIEREHVVVRSDAVKAPKAVRFAWDEEAQPNLVNGAGLPALPFRTDRPE